jgi:hypothetical protein
VFAKISKREVLHVDQFKWAGVEIALGLIARHLAKHLDVFFRLDALGDDLDLKAVSKRDDGSGDGTAVFVDVAA